MRLWRVVLLSVLISGCSDSEQQQCIKTLVDFHDYTGSEAHSLCVGYYSEQQLIRTADPYSQNQDHSIITDHMEITPDQAVIEQQKQLARSDNNFRYWFKM